MNLLVAVEILALVAWIALSATLVVDRSRDTGPRPIDKAALVSGAGRERWNGIFFQDQHVGYAVSRASPTTDGGVLFEERSLFRVATFGALREVVTAGSAVVDGQGDLRQFSFFMTSDAVRLSVQGEVQGDEIVMHVDQAGERNEVRFPLSQAPMVGVSLEARIAAEPLRVGHSFEVPYFDPVTMAEGTMEIRVDDVVVLEDGEEAWWLRQRFRDVETRVLVLSTGEMIRQEGALGLAMVRMTAEQAQAIPTSAGEDVDLIALSAVKLDRPLPAARDARRVALRIQGIEASKVRHEPPLQTLAGDVVTVDIPLLEELPELPVRDETDPQWLAGTLTLPVQHRLIVDRAEGVVGDATTRVEATRRLVEHVFEYVEKVPTIGVPNGLEVLQNAQGDCNEHTALFVSLARAAGIPARIAAGVVYSDRIGDKGAFYYHAWPEVRLGGPTDWVPVDPTFGQFPADATHVKLVEGDLDRQVEIMGFMGRLRFDLVEVVQ